MTNTTVPALHAETDLNNDHSVDGISPSSKSRTKRKPAGGARRHLSRLNDTAVRIPQGKRPNAQKHGALSTCPTIPGETGASFKNCIRL
jgi:hypothetical protein